MTVLHRNLHSQSNNPIKPKPNQPMKNKTPDLPNVEGAGVTEKRIRSVDDAAEEYVDARDKRMTLTKQEVEKKEKLKSLMLKHGLNRYTLDDDLSEVVVDPGEADVKVRRIKQPKGSKRGD